MQNIHYRMMAQKKHRTYVTKCLVKFLISLYRNIAVVSEIPEHCSKEKMIL